jgi:hypothetical protein
MKWAQKRRSHKALHSEAGEMLPEGDAESIADTALRPVLGWMNLFVSVVHDGHSWVEWESTAHPEGWAVQKMQRKWAVG